MKKSFDIYIVQSLLGAEWRHICSRLEPSVASRLKTPLFILTSNAALWGAWHGGSSQTIELREELLLEHPWSSVLEILKHETAHQVTELLYGDSVPPHGPEFHRVCKALGANPLASGKYAPPDIDIFAENAQADEGARSVFEKIRKLLALSQSDNQHEAEVALTKARELMAKYGISQAPGDNELQDFTLLTPTIPTSWPQCIVSMLSHILCDYAGVRVIITSEPNLCSGKRRKVATFLGSKLNLRLAGYACDCLVHFLTQCWKQRRSKETTNSYSQSDFTAFAYGVLDSIAASLKKQEEQAPECYGLIPAKQQELDAYISWIFPQLTRRSLHSIRLNGSQYDAGKAAGHDFHLRQGIEHDTGQQRKLLKR